MSPHAIPILAALAALFCAASPRAEAALHLSEVASFDQPVHLAAPPQDPHRLFVVERAGRIVVVRDGQKLDPPFLDIAGDVRAGGGEQGLLSMAFAPDYATSGRFYVYYTANRPGDARGSVITVDEFRHAPGNLDAADPASRRRVLSIDHPGQSNHNGGQLQFGPDGLLYAGTGDGGGGNDRGADRPANNAQNPASLLGKLLRINPTAPGATPEIYASGLRNPWRFSFDRASGDLTIGDVGQGVREEVNFTPRGTPPGTNYGWVCWEGTLRNPNANPTCDPPDDVFPVLERDHAGDGFCAIVGGYVVRDPALPELAGRYVYGDNCQNDLRSASLAAPRATDDRASGLTVGALTSFGEDSCGHVYAVSGTGPVFRIDGDAFTPCPEPGPAPDATAPVVTTSARRRQRVLRQRGFRLAVRCSERCGATVTGVVRISGSRRVHRLRRVARQLGAGKRRKLTLRARRRQLRTFAAALRRGRRVKVTFTVVARDAAGNEATAKRRASAAR
jgi:glucose/arabinose dehydrogenase